MLYGWKWGGKKTGMEEHRMIRQNTRENEGTMEGRRYEEGEDICGCDDGYHNGSNPRKKASMKISMK